MKQIYLGHEITVTREPSMMGDELLFYAVFRVADGYECTSGYSYGDETPSEFCRLLKEQVDEEMKSKDPWGEHG